MVVSVNRRSGYRPDPGGTAEIIPRGWTGPDIGQGQLAYDLGRRSSYFVETTAVFASGKTLHDDRASVPAWAFGDDVCVTCRDLAATAKARKVELDEAEEELSQRRFNRPESPPAEPLLGHKDSSLSAWVFLAFMAFWASYLGASALWGRDTQAWTGPLGDHTAPYLLSAVGLSLGLCGIGLLRNLARHRRSGRAERMAFQKRMQDWDDGMSEAVAQRDRRATAERRARVAAHLSEETAKAVAAAKWS